MSPAAKDENPEQPEAAAPDAEVEETAATEAAEPQAAAGEAADTKTADTKAADTKAADTKAADTKTADTKAADTKAAKAKAANSKAAAAEPADTEAAEGDAAGTEVDEEAAKPDAAAKPARRRAAASAESEDKPARSTSRSTTKTTKTPAKKAKAPAASTEVKVDLPAHIFDAKVNVPLIHQVVVGQQAAARQGTHATKTRGEVRGGGRKPYRQKGTGRARQGSVRAPQFAGGGTVFGPVPRSYVQKTPKKMKVAALRGALSDRARHGLVHVVGGFVDGDTPKTADAVAVLAAVTGSAAGSARVLVVADSSDQVTWRSLRNATGVHLIDPGQLNTYDVLTSDRVVFTSAAFESFVARSSQQEDR
jgi:large subunit ribosomal protein L4